MSEKRPSLLARLAAFLVTAALVVGGVALVAYRDRINLDTLRRYLAYRTLEKNESGQAAEFHYTGDESNSFAALGNGLLVCSKTSIQLFSQSGALYIEKNASMANPVVSVGGGKAVVYDVGGERLYVYADRQEVFSLSGKRILSARMSESGALTVITQGSGYKGVVTAYDAGFQEVIDVNISSTFVMDAVTSPNGRWLAVVALGQNGSAFESSLRIYDTRGSTGEPVSVSSLGDDVALDMQWDEEGVWVQLEHGVALAGEDGTVKAVWSNSGLYLKEFSLGGDGFAALFMGRYRSGNLGELILVDGTGTQTAGLNIQDEVLSISAAGRYVAVLHPGSLVIYDQNLEACATATLGNEVRRVILRPDGTAMLIGSESARLYVPG
ncbi:MAG: hypothetical protein HFF18_06195 [Oscillospiraceae bacterium]|nr:hypothetical protein [Oscillospiraceae bacterium]